MTNLFLDNNSFAIISNSALASMQYTKFAMCVVPVFMAVLPGLVALFTGCIMHLMDFLRGAVEEEYEQYQNSIEPARTLAKDIMRPVTRLDRVEIERSTTVKEQKALAVVTDQVVYSEPEMLPEVDPIEDLYLYLIVKTIDFSAGEMLPA